MLSEAEDILFEPTSKLFQLFWEKVENPDLWNRDNKIFIPKLGKPHYYSAKSYRPISLASVIGEMFEHIINRRLIW